jgi:hypothetical protein
MLGLEMTWKQWYGKTSKTRTYWQICIDHHQKATFMMNMEKLNLPLLKTTIDMWTTLTKGTEWLLAIQLVREHGSGQKTFFHLLDLTTLNSYIILLSWCSKTNYGKFHLVLVQNLLEMSIREPHPQSTPRWRPNPDASQMKHWPVAVSCLRCCEHSKTQLPNVSASLVQSTCVQAHVSEFTTPR